MNILDKIKNEEELSVNITSMIDVIFILLVFFMVSTQFKKSALPLELPTTQESVTSQEDNSTKTLSVNNESIELDQEDVSLDELEERLTELYKSNPEIAISLECDKNVPFERVVQILSKIQNAGISKIGIIHDTTDEEN